MIIVLETVFIFLNLWVWKPRLEKMSHVQDFKISGRVATCSMYFWLSDQAFSTFGFLQNF